MSQLEDYNAGQWSLYNQGYNNGLNLDKSIVKDRKLINKLKEEHAKGEKMPPYSKGLFTAISANESLEDLFADLRARQWQGKYEDYEPDI